MFIETHLHATSQMSDSDLLETRLRSTGTSTASLATVNVTAKVKLINSRKQRVPGVVILIRTVCVCAVT